MSWRGSDELTFGESILGVFGILVVLAIMVLLSSCTPSHDLHRLCVTADAAGRMLTISGAALREVHDLDVDAAWAKECSHGSVEQMIVCRHRVVDELAAKYRDRYATAAQAVEAQHALADALEEAGVCKEPAK